LHNPIIEFYTIGIKLKICQKVTNLGCKNGEIGIKFSGQICQFNTRNDEKLDMGRIWTIFALPKKAL
jgi:hypothetical protein